MALHGNYSVFNKTPCRHLGGTSTAHASGIGSAQVAVPSNWQRGGALRNLAIQDLATDALEYASIPTGYSGEGWLMPVTEGGISSHNILEGEGALTGAAAAGKNAQSAIDGTGTLTATGQLVVSGSAALSGTGTLAGNVVAALAASGALSGSGSLTGTSIAKGFMSVALTGTGTLEGIRYAVGFMSANIAPATQLEAAEFSTYVLDQEDVETGLTVRNALRLIAAATAGELSGAASTTITIRNAVADDKDRIVATVTSEGNRTAITYDLTDS